LWYESRFVRYCEDLHIDCWLTLFLLSVPRKMNTNGQFFYTANTVSVVRNNFCLHLTALNKKRYIRDMNQGLIFIQSIKYLNDSCKWEVCKIWSELYACITQTKIKLVQLHMGLHTKFHWNWCDSVRAEACIQICSTYVPTYVLEMWMQFWILWNVLVVRQVCTLTSRLESLGMMLHRSWEISS
jgi:hypothetical protein